MKLIINQDDINKARQAKKEGKTVTSCCPTVQGIKRQMGVEKVIVGFQSVFMLGQNHDFIMDDNLRQQVWNWTFHQTFEPGEYQLDTSNSITYTVNYE